jgi:hypothetical protein
MTPEQQNEMMTNLKAMSEMLTFVRPNDSA